MRTRKSKTLQKIFKHIIADIENGSALYDAFGKYPRVFGDFFINIVKVGEVSGSLAENLDFLAQAFDKKQSLESKAIGALIYPIILLIAFPITLITLGLFSFVVNAGLFWWVGSFVKGFYVAGFVPALLGSLVVSATVFIVDKLLSDN